MTYQPASIQDGLKNLPQLPGWVTTGRAETPEDVVFLSGAALSHLHLVLNREAVPEILLRERLALRAAEACVAHVGCMERAGELRDAVQFLRPGDQPGPAGEIYLSWRRAVERPLSITALHRSLPSLEPEQIATWLDVGQGAPVSRAVSVLQAVLEDNPRPHETALLVADAALARGAARLRAVAPKLRAKGANEAVALFLTRDAVAPTALTSRRSNRAARRLCDRLVVLGAVRELTGRDTFRLYGL